MRSHLLGGRRWLAAGAVLATAATVFVAWGADAPPAAAADPVVVVNDTFEDGTVQGWAPRADEVVAHSTAVAHAGTGSLVVTGRTRTWEGPVKNVLTTMRPGTRYTFAVWVRLAAGTADTQLRLSLERRWQETPNYEQITGNTTVTAGGWTLLTGGYTLANDVDFLTVYVEAASSTNASFHIDDFSISYLPEVPIQTDIPALKTFLANDFKIGAAVSRAQLLGNHAQLLSRHFNSVTAGNAMKWDATEPTEGTYNWTDADAIVAYANANGMEVRGHTLVWHNQTPAWVFQNASGGTLTNSAADKAILLTRLENHIRAVAGRYAADIEHWDVANEVIDENQSDGLRRSNWYTIAGLDYLRVAFRVAREVAPNAKLFINDYNTNVAAKRDKLYALVSQLRAEGVPIDGVGHQMHVNIDWPSVSDTEAMLTKFIPLGVDQQITEMDVSVYTNSSETLPVIPEERLIRQANRYRDLFALYRRYKDNISSVTLWGLADDDTWLSTYPIARLEAPLLFDTRLQAKPAYWGIVDPTRVTPSPSAGSPSPSRSSASPSASSASPSPSRSGASPSPSRSSGSPSPSGSAAPGGCAVDYTVVGSWPGGFQGEVRITNTGTAAVNGWTLRWTFANGQQVTQAWGGTATQSGAAVTVTNAAWSGALAPGATVTVGFLANWTGGNAEPTAFTLNGGTCAVR
jgi:endo-1,4-beta-xylanase